MSRRVLHPSDFSRASGAAFKKAVEMAKAGRGQLMVVHVLSSVAPFAGEGYVSPRMYEDIAASSRAWAGKQLGKLVAKAKAAGVRAKAYALEGVAHDQIARIALGVVLAPAIAQKANDGSASKPADDQMSRMMTMMEQMQEGCRP